MKPKYNDYVTVVDNETNKEISGYIKKYAPDEIILYVPIKFNAKKVHFKRSDK